MCISGGMGGVLRRAAVLKRGHRVPPAAHANWRRLKQGQSCVPERKAAGKAWCEENLLARLLCMCAPPSAALARSPGHPPKSTSEAASLGVWAARRRLGPATGRGAIAVARSRCARSATRVCGNGGEKIEERCGIPTREVQREVGPTVAGLGAHMPHRPQARTTCAGCGFARGRAPATERHRAASISADIALSSIASLAQETTTKASIRPPPLPSRLNLTVGSASPPRSHACAALPCLWHPGELYAMRLDSWPLCRWVLRWPPPVSWACWSPDHPGCLARHQHLAWTSLREPASCRCSNDAAWCPGRRIAATTSHDVHAPPAGSYRQPVPPVLQRRGNTAGHKVEPDLLCRDSGLWGSFSTAECREMAANRAAAELPNTVSGIFPSSVTKQRFAATCPDHHAPRNDGLTDRETAHVGTSHARAIRARRRHRCCTGRHKTCALHMHRHEHCLNGAAPRNLHARRRCAPAGHTSPSCKTDAPRSARASPSSRPGARAHRARLAATAISSKTGATPSIDGSKTRTCKPWFRRRPDMHLCENKLPRGRGQQARPGSPNMLPRNGNHAYSPAWPARCSPSGVIPSHNRFGFDIHLADNRHEPHGRPYTMGHHVHPSLRERRRSVERKDSRPGLGIVQVVVNHTIEEDDAVHHGPAAHASLVRCHRRDAIEDRAESRNHDLLAEACEG